MSSPEADEPEQPDDSHLTDEAVFADIVANYGAQPAVVEQDVTESVVAHVFDDDVDEEPVWDDIVVDDDIMLPGDFVPPEPDALGWHGARSVAWIGVLGSPALAVLWTLLAQGAGWTAPSWLAYLLIGGFLGGFAYLVLTMPKDRDDPWDDGARV